MLGGGILNKPHKWAKEIKAWADGAEIQSYWESDGWIDEICPNWRNDYEYRIKPQPKEPQYLYVYNKGSLDKFDFYCSLNELTGMDARTHQFIGKLKLENENE